MFYKARWYDSALGRFAQADTIIPGAFNPMAFDRYAYVFNSPLNYVDPSGHRTCTDRQAKKDAETCRQNYIVKGIESEILLLTIAVFAEAMGGDPAFPGAWIAMIAWTLLNRVSSGAYDSLYDAISGDQTAFDAYANEYTGWFPKSSNETPAEYATRFFSHYDINDPGWARVYSIVQAVYQAWLEQGTASTADPTHGATDFRAKQLLDDLTGTGGYLMFCQGKSTKNCEVMKANPEITDEILSLSYEGAMAFNAYQSKYVPGWKWSKVGPVTVRGVTFWLFFDNRSWLANGN